jgi:MFS family permease
MSATLDEEFDEAQRWSPAGLAEQPGKDARWFATKGMIRLLVTNAMYGYSLASFFLLPKHLAVSFAASPAQIGRVTGILSTASLLCFPILGPALRRLGYRRASVLGFLLLALGAAAFPLFSRIGIAMLGARVIQGIAAAGVFAAGLAMAAAFAPKDKLAQTMGLVGSASLAMGAVAPALGEPLAARFGFTPVFLLAALAAVVGAWVSLGLPDGGRELPATGTAAPARGKALPVLATLAIVGAGYNVVMAFLAPFALRRGFPAVSGFFISYTLAALFIRVFCGRITDAFGTKRTAAGGIVIYGLVIAGIGVFGPAQRVLWGVLFGLAHGALFPALMAMLFERVPATARARLAALSNSVIHLGMMGVFAFGALAGVAGFPAVFVLTGGLVGGAAWLVERRGGMGGADNP